MLNKLKRLIRYTVNPKTICDSTIEFFGNFLVPVYLLINTNCSGWHSCLHQIAFNEKGNELATYDPTRISPQSDHHLPTFFVQKRGQIPGGSKVAKFMSKQLNNPTKQAITHNRRTHSYFWTQYDFHFDLQIFKNCDPRKPAMAHFFEAISWIEVTRLISYLILLLPHAHSLSGMT